MLLENKYRLKRFVIIVDIYNIVLNIVVHIIVIFHSILYCEKGYVFEFWVRNSGKPDF
jgi:hypothetical protein